jgi:hypothetical protein
VLANPLLLVGDVLRLVLDTTVTVATTWETPPPVAITEWVPFATFGTTKVSDAIPAEFVVDVPSVTGVDSNVNVTRTSGGNPVTVAVSELPGVTTEDDTEIAGPPGG